MPSDFLKELELFLRQDQQHLRKMNIVGTLSHLELHSYKLFPSEGGFSQFSGLWILDHNCETLTLMFEPDGH